MSCRQRSSASTDCTFTRVRVIRATWVLSWLSAVPGTIGNCAYCWWTTSSTAAPYYGAAFVSTFLGTDGAKLAMLDDGKSASPSHLISVG